MSDQNQMDAMLNFWRDAWTRAAAGGSNSATADADPMANPAAWMPSPEAVKKMQGAFLDAMAGSAEQYMRSPQFLDSMRQSMESAVGMRTQMEEYLRKNMGDSFRTPGDASAQVMALLTEMEARLNARLDELSDRLDAIAGGSIGRTSPRAKSPSPKSPTPKSQKGKSAAKPAKKSTRRR